MQNPFTLAGLTAGQFHFDQFAKNLGNLPGDIYRGAQQVYNQNQPSYQDQVAQVQPPNPAFNALGGQAVEHAATQALGQIGQGVHQVIHGFSQPNLQGSQEAAQGFQGMVGGAEGTLMSPLTGSIEALPDQIKNPIKQGTDQGMTMVSKAFLKYLMPQASEETLNHPEVLNPMKLALQTTLMAAAAHDQGLKDTITDRQNARPQYQQWDESNKLYQRMLKQAPKAIKQAQGMLKTETDPEMISLLKEVTQRTPEEHAAALMNEKIDAALGNSYPRNVWDSRDELLTHLTGKDNSYWDVVKQAKEAEDFAGFKDSIWPPRSPKKFTEEFGMTQKEFFNQSQNLPLPDEVIKTFKNPQSFEEAAGQGKSNPNFNPQGEDLNSPQFGEHFKKPELLQDQGAGASPTSRGVKIVKSKK